ncbi:hypothetical protein [Devosia sp. Leaf64]|uniref:hypothetical protein n=1 Tax=Devosia sp. Leaf64 TaxID=1736229 RepID=UPI000713FF85|nr:hypothetical protein [Devosia sp. Leaf64]KQN73446.1 hypothetical protein ASE94_06320 [Devosia sp. Leaf64]
MANYFYPSKKYEDDSLISPAKASPEVLCDWAVDIDRISRLAREAFLKGTPDPWAKVEAECVAQLIEAEWIALNERPCNDHRVEATIRHLKTLKTEAVLAIKTLESVERYGSRETAATIADPQHINKPPNRALAAA